MISLKSLAFLGIIVSVTILSKVPVTAQMSETDGNSENESRMKWWEEARFGMFLHWGVYSSFGGEWEGVDHGKEMGGASAEWIYLRADIPHEDYEKAAAQFNPVNYDPDNWVRMAKEAGMKYMVLTSKHHDGFALFDTRASDWNIMQSSSYKKDIIKMYTDACHAADMRVGLYFSHEKDWFHHSKINRDTSQLSDEYKEITKTHLKELLTNYGRIDILWFDMGIEQHTEFNRALYDLVRKYQPECIISSRIGNHLGDYQNLGDRKLAPPGMEGSVESIMTLRLNWGYDKNDSDWKSSDEVISMLSKCACRSSNFLLNMGPQPDGRFSPEEMVRLKSIGEWMQHSSEAIYNTSGSPFEGEYWWGSLSSKEKKVYLHLFRWHDGVIQANGILSTVKKAYMLYNGEELQFEQEIENASLSISIPGHANEAVLPIVVLELDTELEVDKKKGPVWIPETIHHTTRSRISGVAGSVNGTHFTIKSRGKEHHFTLNENVKYRISKNGEITEVQGYYLESGQNYIVAYTPGSEPVVEIITVTQ